MSNDDDDKPPTTRRSGPPVTLGQLIDHTVAAEVERKLATEGKRRSSPRLEVPRPRLPPLVEQAAAAHRDFALDAMRKQSDSDAEQAVTMESIMMHVRRSDTIARDTATAVAIIGRELGVLNKLPSSLQSSIAPPPMPIEAKRPLRARLREAVRSLKKRDRPLPELARKQNVVATIVVVAELVDKLLPLFQRLFSAH